jgi:cell division protein FtsB
MLRGPQGLRALAERRQEIRKLEEQNANLMRDIQQKKDRIERLKHDPGTQEMVVEGYLGKVHPGDTQFKVSGQRITSKPDGAAVTASELPSESRPAQ